MTPCSASKYAFSQGGFVRFNYLLSLLFFLLTFALSSAQAAVDVTDVTGASRTEGVNGAEGAALTIFGGLAGSTVACGATTDVCDSCVSSTATINGGSPAPCNTRRILPSTELTITFTAGKAGFPTITGSDKITLIDSEGSSVAAGASASITTTWGTLCSRAGDSGITATCDPATAGAVETVSLLVGVSETNDSTLDDTNDESTSFTVTISDVMDGLPLTASCAAPPAANSVCEYSIQSGDEKAVLTDLGKYGDFPNLSGIGISALRVYFEPCSWPNGFNAAGFNTIAPASNFVDLEITTDADGAPELLESEITGLQNGLTYCTKIGHVDDAGNVGLFTPAAADGDCTNVETFLKDGSGNAIPQTCHMARPDEVLGVLAESCFIATAAYGSPWAIKVQTFRDFRNKFLLSNQVGRKLVKFYYKHSPKFAKQIASSDLARGAARVALSPLWLFAKISLAIGFVPALLTTLALIVTPFALLRRRKLKATT